MTQPAQRSPKRRQRLPSLGRSLVSLGGLAAGVFAVRWIFLWLRRVTLFPTPYRTLPIGPDQVEPQRRRLVLSDLHLGGGDRLDDFEDDQRLSAFLDQYAGAGAPTELILAGDTFEFLQVRLPAIDDDDYSDGLAALRLQAMIAAHASVVAALARFIADPRHQLTVLIGNHDFELHYPAAKARLAAG